MTPFSLTAIDFQWLPILPLITIAIAAIVVLLVGVRVPDDESDGLGWLAIASIAIAFVLTLAMSGQNTTAFAGSLAIDDFAVFFRARDPVRRRSHRADVAQLCRRLPSPGRRILLADTVRRARHDADGGGRRPDHYFSRPRNHVDRDLRPGRPQAHRPALRRGGDQVLPAGRVFDRLPALRNRAGLRRRRYDQAGADSRRARPWGRAATVRFCCSASR